MEMNDTKKIETINKIFSTKTFEILDEVYLDETKLQNITEEEYKKQMKEEIIFYKGKIAAEICGIEMDKIKGQSMDYGIYQLRTTVISTTVHRKKQIYDIIPEDLIDLFVDECYKRNIEYIKNGKKDKKILIYKSAWKNSNSLWKLFHQKYNPKKINLDNMQSNDIEKLEEEIGKWK